MNLKKFILISIAAVLFLTAAAVYEPEAIRGNPYIGAQLYDAWYIYLALTPKEELHPLWEQEDMIFSSNDVTWRCSTCHGWDYKGVDGMPGVIDVVGKSEEEILAWINGEMNPRHDFAPYMNSEQKIDLVAFLRTQLVDIDLLVDSETGLSLGNIDAGTRFYYSNCSDCHGDDAQGTTYGANASTWSLIPVAVNTPDRFIHKVRFSSPTRDFHNAIESGYTIQDLADVLAFIQSLDENFVYAVQEGAAEEYALEDYAGQGEVLPIMIAGLFIYGAVTITTIVIRWRKNSSA